MKKFFRQRIDFLIPLVVLIFSSIVSFYGVGEGIINYIDHNYPFFISDYLGRLFYAWSDYIYLGYNHSVSLSSNIGNYLIFGFFETLGLGYRLVNRLEHLVAVFCIIYFTYLFLTSITKKQVEAKDKLALLLVSTFFLTNIMSLGLFSMGITQQILAFSGIPLALYGIRKQHEKKNRFYYIPVMFSAFIIASFNLPYSIISLFSVGLLVLLFQDFNLREKMISLLLYGLFWIVINAYWLVPMGYSIFVVPPYNMNASIENTEELEEVLVLTSNRYRMNYLMGLLIDLRLIMKQNADSNTIKHYFASNWILVLSMVVIVLMVYRYLVNQKQRVRGHAVIYDPLIVILVLLFFLFLSKGMADPLGDIYARFFQGSNIFKMFRDSLKWMTVVYLLFLVLSANYILETKNRFLKGLILGFFAIYLVPWFFGLFGQLKAYQVPDYYFDFRQHYLQEKNLTNKRALILDSKVGATKFTFDTTDKERLGLSNNILKFISPIPVVDLFSNGSGVSFDYIRNGMEILKKDDRDIDFFKKLGLTHVYRQRDLRDGDNYSYSDQYFNKKTFGNLDVYEMKQEYILPKVFLSDTDSSAELSFTKLNPTKYIFRIKNLNTPAKLNFQYTYDDNWQVYPGDYRGNDNCRPLRAYTITAENSIDSQENNRTKTIECEASTRGNLFAYFAYLLKGKKFNGEHYLSHYYANAWNIDPVNIKKNFPTESYKVNPDGSIDFELIMYFKAQNYFYFGIGISLISVVGIFLWIFLSGEDIANMRNRTTRE